MHSRNISLIPILAGVFFAADDQTVVVTILPQIMSDLRIEITELHRAAWTVTGYLLGYVAIMPVMGGISDIIGRRTIYTWALVIFSLGSIGTALTGSLNPLLEWQVLSDSHVTESLVKTTTTLEWVVITRIIQAIGAGALVPISIAMVADLFKDNERSLPLGLVGAAAESGAVIGPLWGGIITQFLSWQWVFWLNIPISILVIIMMRLTVPKTIGTNAKIDYLGSILIVCGFCIVTVAFTEISRSMLTMILLSGLGIGLFFIYALYASKNSNSIIPITLFKNLGFIAANIVHLLYGAALIITLVTIPLMANTVLQGSPLDGGLMLGRLTIAIPIGAVVGSLICRTHDVRLVAIPGLLLCTISLIAMSTWNEAITNPWMTIHLIAGGLGFGLLITPITLTAINSASNNMKGSAAGIISSSRFAGMTLGIAGLSAWGAGKFSDLLAGIELPLPTKGETSGQIVEKNLQFQNELTSAGVNLFSDFYILAAIICLASVVVSTFMVSNRINS